MKFAEADKKFAELRPDTYRSISFQKIIFEDGTVETECCLYHNGGGKVYSASTFQGAFDLMNPPVEEMQGEIEA